MPQEPQKVAAPYLPWKTFLSSLDVFTEGIPPIISRGVWRQSGLMQGLIMGAYRFFGLIDDDDKPTTVLEMLVDGDRDRQMVMQDVLKGSYPQIMTHDLKTTTFDMLNNLIEQYNVSGATKKKAITFFLQAAKYAGLPLSTFIQVRSTGPRRRRSRNGEEHSDNLTPIFQPPTGSVKVVELNSGGKVTLSVSVDFLALSEGDRKFVFDLVDRLGAYSPSLSATVRRLTEAKL